MHIQATPHDPHGVQEVFAVWLSVEPVVPLTLPAEVDPATQTALLEPSGVVQLARTAFSGVERTGYVRHFKLIIWCVVSAILTVF